MEFDPKALYNLSDTLAQLILKLDQMETNLKPLGIKKKYFGKLEQRGIVTGTYEKCSLTDFGNNIKSALLGE